MEDLSIYHNKYSGVYLSGYQGVTDILSIGVEDPENFVSQEFTREKAIQIRDWLSELIEESAPPPPPTNADIIEALTPGSVFTVTNTYDNKSTIWFRTETGAVKDNRYFVGNFEGWIGNHVTVEVNYIHKSEESN